MLRRKFKYVSNKNIELLAPVGSMESLYAAVQNGADAVYLGGKVFSARQYANNFDYEELEEAVDYAHLRGVKVYVTVNILMDDLELDQAIDYINFLYNIDVDGLIVQDMGLAFLVKELFPRFELHGSTQMTVNNLEGALFLEKLGFTRVVLARETPIEEIRRIKENSSIELEGFIHGALCVAYSGQCLMSSLIGGRSGNRGSCAQPCRKKYRIVEKASKNPIKNFEGAYVLSSRDLNTIDHIDEIIDSGIVSLKIEGRMKKPEYVATVVSKYRKVLDQDRISQEDKLELKEIFNREFTKGIGLKDFGSDFLSYEKPNNKGLLVGQVDSFDKNNIYIKLVEDLSPGDSLKIVTDRGKDFIVHWKSNNSRGELIRIDNTRGVSKGREIYRTSNLQLLEKARESYVLESKNYPIDLSLELRLGQKPRIESILDGELISIETDFMIEEAKKAGLDRDKVRDQIDKLGDTVYYLRQVDINMDPNIFMPLREINELRRAMVQEIDARRKNFNKRSPLSRSLKDFKDIDPIETKNYKGLSVYARSYEIFSRLDLSKLDRLYIGFTDNWDRVFERLPKDLPVFLWTDKILYQDDFRKMENLLEDYKDRFTGVFINNLGSLYFFKDRFKLKLHGGEGLNVFNDYAGQFFRTSGLESLSLSAELRLGQIEKIAAKGHNSYEVLGYGYLPVMINEACPMSLIKKCNYKHDCETCLYNKGYSLVDEMKAEFYFERVNNKTKIYNSVPIMTLDFVDRIYQAGVDFVRLDFNFDHEEVEDIQRYFYDYIKGTIGRAEVDRYFKTFRERNKITKGHFYRGVME